MIIIAGDSWGTGEISYPFDFENIGKNGLHHYLALDGYEVLNVSVLGNSLFNTINDISTAIHQLALQQRLSELTDVFVFQTEWHRDFKICKQSLGDLVKIDNSYLTPVGCNLNFIQTVISRWQYRLSEIAQKYNFRVGLIGGCSDTVWLDNFEDEYPNLYIACQSVTNLCLNNNHRIDNPVFAARIPPELLNAYKNDSAFNDTDLEFILNHSDQGNQRIQLWRHNKEWFWPDGVHLNRIGHKKLFDYLKQQNYF
jgi:hypothetical protein